MKRLIVFAALLTTVASPRMSAAQSPLSLEVTGSGVMPTQTLGGAGMDTGFGFGANLRFRFLPHLAAYTGWEWHHNSSDELLASSTTDIEDTGYTFGLRFEHPLTAETAYWIRAGGLYNHIELENTDGNLISDTGHGLGWEAGAGLTIPLGPRIALTPGLRYRTLTRDLEVGGGTNSVTLSYVTVGVGVAFTF